MSIFQNAGFYDGDPSQQSMFRQNGLQNSGLSQFPGMTQGAIATEGQTTPASYEQEMIDKATAAQDQGNQMAAYQMLARGIQSMAPRAQFPSGNTAQIIRDSNQFRFAGTPQQQMAQALRNRG